MMLPRLFRARFLFLTLGLAVSSGAFGADELRIIALKHRTAAEVMPLIRPLLGPEDALSGTDYRLIVRAPALTVQEIERVLAQVDVARQSLRITVAQDVEENRDTTRHSVEGEVRIGDRGRITLPRVTAPPDGVVVEKDGVRYSASRRTHSSNQSHTQTIATVDGQRAYIRIGQSVPQVRRILGFVRHHPIVIEEVELRDITTGFTVLPRVRGDRVQLEITPRLARLRDPATGLVDFQELTATVEAKRGEWLDLSAIFGERGEVERAILESATTESGERRRVRLKVD